MKCFYYSETLHHDVLFQKVPNDQPSDSTLFICHDQNKNITLVLLATEAQKKDSNLFSIVFFFPHFYYQLTTKRKKYLALLQ